MNGDAGVLYTLFPFCLSRCSRGLKRQRCSQDYKFDGELNFHQITRLNMLVTTDVAALSADQGISAAITETRNLNYLILPDLNNVNQMNMAFIRSAT
jgi:hypothetical protein